MTTQSQGAPRAGLAKAWLTLLLLLLAVLPGSCNAGDSLLRAKQIETRHELVGGPVAMADVGDFLLENDQIRVAILGPKDSPAPGVFGGSVVDIDRRRADGGLGEAMGHDRFSESFPMANLLVPEPGSTDVTVLDDGSDGRRAVIRVEGTGEFLFEALAILRSKKALLETLFPDVRTSIHFTTDYELRPGWRYVRIHTTLRLGDETKAGCPDVSGCGLTCEHGLAQDPGGCVLCECSDNLSLPRYTAPVSVFGTILGDAAGEADAAQKAGLTAGDFVFFGNQNDVFAPGPGFDEDAAVQGANNSGRNTFEQPLVFDFVAASGGDISYGYFTKRQEGAEPPLVNVPLFASAATAFLVAGVSCSVDAADDATCDRNRTFSYERFLAVGEGDIASVVDVVHEARGEKTGTLKGNVYWGETGEPAHHARLVLFDDPDPDREFRSAAQLIEHNIRARGDAGILNAIDADLGLDNELDGDFHANMRPGTYLVVARDHDGTVSAPPLRVRVKAGEDSILAPVLPTPARVDVRITDGEGAHMPGKVALIALDSDGKPREGDGRRLPAMGDGRIGNGVRALHFLAHGQGSFAVEPGRYAILVSRGMEYGIHLERDITLTTGELLRVDAMLVHEVNTKGWMSTDMHLHSRPSFDSGMPVARRVTTAAAEGVELAVATDHDVATDYLQELVPLKLEPFIKSAIGAEITTLEQGHFLGFPLAYDELDVPTHGAHDWTCHSGGRILDEIRNDGDGIKPFTIVAHPRDGFFGYVDQLGVDGFTMNRKPTLLEADNPVFRTASCDFDAMEIISAKRNDLTRTATIGEMVDFNRCLGRINAAEDVESLTTACPEVSEGLLAGCGEQERYELCQDRNRTRLATVMMRRILERTPAEQDANWGFSGTMADSQALCDVEAFGDDPVPELLRDAPCAYRVGQIDDYFRYLEHGLTPTQVGSSDSHNDGKEPGFPRTYFRSETDSPAALSVSDAVDSLRAGHAFATYGPFVRATIDDKTFGEVARGKAGGDLELLVDVETASWFGVDRVEVYLNGRLARVVEPESEARDIVDVRGKVSFTVPDRDSWIVIIAMGLKTKNLLGPVSVDVPFGEVQLSKVASDAFARVPVVNTLFKAPPVVPSWGPMFPYAVTNPIYIDVDGNGRYDSPLPLPEWCSRRCDPANTDPAQCPEGQVCLEDEGVCGYAIVDHCIRRPAASHGH